MWAQLWKTARTLGITFLLIAGLGAVMEEKGLSRGMLANPDMTPQLETTTKFADVKGVDEAKVTPPPPLPACSTHRVYLRSFRFLAEGET